MSRGQRSHGHEHVGRLGVTLAPGERLIIGDDVVVKLATIRGGRKALLSVIAPGHAVDRQTIRQAKLLDAGLECSACGGSGDRDGQTHEDCPACYGTGGRLGGAA